MLQEFDTLPIEIAKGIDEARTDRVIEDFRLTIERLMQSAHHRGPFGGYARTFFIQYASTPVS
jgi:hypothetical protein